MDEWVYVPEDPLLAGFEEELLFLVAIPGAGDAVAWKLKEIQRNPKWVGSAWSIDGDIVYLTTTGRYGKDVPPLLIAYLLDVRERIIRPFLVCKADGVTLPPTDGAPRVSGGTAPEPVEDRIRRALRRRNKPDSH
jgi:hypothetical protein